MEVGFNLQHFRNEVQEEENMEVDWKLWGGNLDFTRDAL